LDYQQKAKIGIFSAVDDKKKEGENKKKKEEWSSADDEFNNKEYYIRRHYDSVTESLNIFKDDPLCSLPGV